MFKKIIDGKRAVFFDLDGTIVDTEPLWERAFETVLQLYNADFVGYDELPDGATVPQKWEYIIHTNAEYLSGIPNVAELSRLTHTEYLKIVENSLLEARPGFWDLAAKLKVDKNLKIALVTNSTKEITQKVLSKIGVASTFDLVVTGDEVKKAKPAPEIFLKAAKTLNVKPAEVLVFEDSLAGASSAVNAGMDLIVIWDGVFEKTAYPENTIMFLPDFESLPGNLDMTMEEAVKTEAQEMLKEQEEHKPDTTTPVA